MNQQINQFCRSHFTYQEKRNVFFPQRPRICQNCHLPKAKKKIDYTQFNILHQGLICMCVHGGAGGHGGAAAGHGGAGAGGHGGAGAGGHGGAAAAGHGGAGAAGHGGAGAGGHGGAGAGGHGGAGAGGHGGAGAGGHGGAGAGGHGGAGAGVANFVTRQEFLQFQQLVLNRLANATQLLNQIEHRLHALEH